MKTPAQLAADAAQAAREANPSSQMLHAVWWSVLRPDVVVNPQTGQPGMQPVHVCETIAEATSRVAQIPGGAICMHAIVFVNPNAAPLIRPARPA